MENDNLRLTIYFKDVKDKIFCQNMIRNLKQSKQLKKTGDALTLICEERNEKNSRINIQPSQWLL